MLLLTATTDILKVTTSSGASYDVDCTASFIDRDSSSGAIGAAARQLSTVTSATTATVVSAPASSTTRKINALFIKNTHASSAVTVLVWIDANGTAYELHKAELLAGESLVYLEQVGFSKLTDTTRNERILILSANSVHATASVFADITGLTCPMKAGVSYGVMASLIHTNNASTTGSRFGFNIGAVPTASEFYSMDVITPSSSAATIASGGTATRDTALAATTTGSTTSRISLILGNIIPSADGTFAMRCSSEVTVANGVTVLAGSWLRVFRATG